MIDQMMDTDALAIVLGGTALATFARCGWGDLRAGGVAVAGLVRRRFDAAANRAAMARAVSAIRARGSLCAETPEPPDPAMAALMDSFIRTGSAAALEACAQGQRIERETACARAVRAFECAGELAPVFGLVGTLFAITGMAPVAGANPATATMGAIATAVLSSLYGVLLAHLVCLPLARAIERAALAEEAARAQIIDWFTGEVTLGLARRIIPARARADEPLRGAA